MFQVTEDLFFRCIHFNSEEFLFFPSVQCQDPMTCQLLDRLLKLIIHFINRLSLRILCHRTDCSFLCGQIPDADTVIRLIGNPFCQNILCSCNSLLHGSHFLLFGKKSLCFFFQWFFGHLKADNICQGLQSLFFGNGCPCTAFWPVRTVQILYHHQSLCFKDLFLQLSV